MFRDGRASNTVVLAGAQRGQENVGQASCRRTFALTHQHLVLIEPACIIEGLKVCSRHLHWVANVNVSIVSDEQNTPVRHDVGDWRKQ